MSYMIVYVFIWWFNDVFYALFMFFLRVGSPKALAFDFLDKVMAEKLAVGPRPY